MTPRRRTKKPGICRYLVVAVALLGHIAGMMGVPLPVSAAKDSTSPFPCQNHACGCTSAEQCWRHCCCYTAEEKLAWARANRVEPPAYAAAKSNGGWNEPRQRDQEVKATSNRPNNCGHCASCGESAKRKEPRKATTGDRARTQRGSWLIGLSARRCQGQGGWCLADQPLAPPPPCLTWNYDWEACSVLPRSDSHACPLLLSPPARPPRA